MHCNECGEAVSMTSQAGGVESGEFVERYECVNGHLGFISGEASDSPEAWEERGQVFGA